MSLKRRVLEALESAVRLIVNDNESDDDSLKSSGSFDEYFVSLLQVAQTKLKNKRYVKSRRAYRIKFDVNIERDLIERHGSDGPAPWLTDKEFLQKYRMCRESFYLLADETKDHLVMEKNNNKEQRLVHHG